MRKLIFFCLININSPKNEKTKGLNYLNFNNCNVRKKSNETILAEAKKMKINKRQPVMSNIKMDKIKSLAAYPYYSNTCENSYSQSYENEKSTSYSKDMMKYYMTQSNEIIYPTKKRRWALKDLATSPDKYAQLHGYHEPIEQFNPLKMPEIQTTSNNNLSINSFKHPISAYPLSDFFMDSISQSNNNSSQIYKKPSNSFNSDVTNSSNSNNQSFSEIFYLTQQNDLKDAKKHNKIQKDGYTLPQIQRSSKNIRTVNFYSNK